MEIRLVTPNEALEARKISAIAFRATQDLHTWDQEAIERSMEFARGVFVDGKLCAVMRLLPQKMHFEGGVVPNGGIASVATLPEYRSKGHIRALFDFVFSEMYESGTLLSYLFPFSFEYYRKFGYELTCDRLALQGMPLDNFAVGKPSQTVRQHWQGEDDGELRRCYEDFVCKYNLPLAREDLQWKQRHLRHDPIKDNVYVYTVPGENGLRGYTIFSAPAGKDANVSVQDMVFDEPETLRSLLAVIKSLSARTSSIALPLPPGFPYDSITTSPFEVTVKIAPHGMGRVMNVLEILRRLRAPNAPGEGVVAVRDEQLSQNNGPWRIEWCDGAVRRVEKTSASPDITLSIGRFSQMAVGHRSLGDMLFYKDAELGENPQRLAPLFPRKELFMLDNF